MNKVAFLEPGILQKLFNPRDRLTARTICQLTPDPRPSNLATVYWLLPFALARALKGVDPASLLLCQPLSPIVISK